MDFLSSPARDFLLHESCIESIDFAKSQICLNFGTGFYDKNHKQLDKCKIIISIEL